MYEANKSLGQNFLLDTSIAQDMAQNLGISGGENVIEVGPGLGAVTVYLSQIVERSHSPLYAVETDSRFIPKLENMFSDNPDAHVINEDILKFLPKFESDRPTKIIGSLPFYITSPILHAIIKMVQQPETVVIMIQKEVAEKILKDAPDASYLSVFIQTFYDVSRVVEVPRDKFKPAPEVDATVIKLTKKSTQMSLERIEKYEGFLHRSFKNPRKMLNKAFSKDELTKGNIKPSLRPQAVSAHEWLNFFNEVCL